MSERTTPFPLHDKYFGTTNKEATAKLPDYLEDALEVPVTADYTERKVLTSAAKIHAWDTLSHDAVVGTHASLMVELADYNDMLNHPDIPVQDPDKAYAERFDASTLAAAEKLVPIPKEAEGKELRELKARRKKALAMMRMQPAAFDAMTTQWERYESIQIADERAAIEAAADREERKVRMAGPEMRRAKAEMSELDKRHGGKFRRVARMPHLSIKIENGQGQMEQADDVDPVTAFNRRWAEFKADKTRFKAALAVATSNKHDEAWLRQQCAESFFNSNLRSQIADEYEQTVGRKILRARASVIKRKLDGDMRLFAEVAGAEPGKEGEANRDFVKYANRERQYNHYKEGHKYAMDALLHGVIIKGKELKGYVDRVAELKGRGIHALSDAELAEMHDLSLLVQDAQHGRVGHSENDDGDLDPKTGKRTRGLSEASRRAIARHRLAARQLSGESKKMKTAVHTAAALRSLVDVSGEVAIWLPRATRKGIGKLAARRAAAAAARPQPAVPRPTARPRNYGA